VRLDKDSLDSVRLKVDINSKCLIDKVRTDHIIHNENMMQILISNLGIDSYLFIN
jgi:hypothetical protein